MRRVQTRLFIWAAVALVYATGLEVQFACGGPGGPMTIFHFDLSPSPDYAEFAAGRLGILDTHFRESQMVVAYRYLSGQVLTEAEQAAVRDYWSGARAPTRYGRAASAWQRLTRTGEGYVPSLSVHRYLRESGLYILNCPDSAFRTAAGRYRFYRKTYGAATPSTVRWLEAQREVFSNCDREGTIPADPDGTFDAVERADRDYQIAAAHFYRTDYDEAYAGFLRISGDEGSDWQGWGVYLAARAMLRKGTVEEDEDALRSALQHFQSVLDSPESGNLHDSAEGLIRLTQRRLDEQGGDALTKAAERLQRQIPIDGVGAAFYDYADLHDRTRLDESAELDPMSAWIGAFEGRIQPDNVDASPAEMDAPTLVVALHHARSNDPDVDELIAAAREASSESPAYATARYHAARLLLDQGRLAQARTVLTEALERNGARLGLSTRNRFRSMRIATADTLDAFYADALPTPLGLLSASLEGRELAQSRARRGFDEYREQRLFSDEAVGFFNWSAPIETLIEGARRESLLRPLRRVLAAAAWTRAVLLNRRPAGRAISPELELLAPEVAESLQAVRNTSDKDWQAEAALVILEYPGWSPFVRPGIHQVEPLEEFHGSTWNWWPGRAFGSPSFRAPGLLSENQQSQGADEFTILRSAGSAADFLGKTTLAWAEAHPDDPRAPRALHRVVYVTRHCCTSEDKGVISKAAFDLLHRRYPESEWAEKTPYWFR